MQFGVSSYNKFIKNKNDRLSSVRPSKFKEKNMKKIIYKTNRNCLLLFILLSYIFSSSVFAEKPSLEWIASEISKQHNNNSEKMKDDITISSTAQAVGKSVTLINIIRTGANKSKQWLDERRVTVYKDTLPKVCKANANNPAFKDGLFYTFLYISDSGQLLAEFIINKEVCSI